LGWRGRLTGLEPNPKLYYRGFFVDFTRGKKIRKQKRKRKKGRKDDVEIWSSF